MVQSAAIPAQPKVLSAQTQFVATLGGRLGALQEAVSSLELDPACGEQRARLRRRLEAMSEAATVLGFESIGAAFSSADNILAQVTDALSARDLSDLRDTLELVPSLVPEHLAQPASREPHGLKDLGPKKIVCLGLLSQQTKLKQALESRPNITHHFTVELEDAVSLVAKYQPDVAMVDGRRIDLSVALQQLRLLAPCVVVEGNAEQLSHLPRQGVSLVTPVGEPYEDVLYKALSAKHPPLPAPPRAEYSVDELVRDLGEQLQQGLLDSIRQGDARKSFPFGKYSEAQSALWTTVARVRELISKSSDGNIEYDEHGPGGALMLTGDRKPGAQRSSASLANLKGRRILVVDDDPAITWFLTGVLRAAGAQVFEADDGSSAWKIALEEYPDLVISDVVMPGLDGFGLCRNLKRDIVLRDIPVILLSWKEDLLQRVRELGVGADFYLAKETDSPVIVQRCAEALQAVARIATRLGEEKVVYGRLDGLTPRQVLQLSCQHVGNAQVIFHDAAFTYEAHTGDGRLLAISRVAKDGTRDRGEAVIPGLLGMRAGRFVIERTSGLVQAELCGSLDDVLAPHIRRARAAMRYMQGAALHEVAKLCLDAGALGPYKLASPAIVSRLVEKLEAGVPPAALLRSVSASLLESVLVDLASRGCIFSALDTLGQDLLQRQTPDLPQPFDVDVHSPLVGEAVLAANGAPLVSAVSSEQDARKAAEFAVQLHARISQSQKPPQVLVTNAAAADPEPPIGERAGYRPSATQADAPAATDPEAIDMADFLITTFTGTPLAPAVGAARPSAPARSRAAEPSAATTSQPVQQQRPVAAPRSALSSPRPAPARLRRPKPPAAAAVKSPSARPSERVVWAQRLRSQVSRLGHWLTKETDSDTPPIAEACQAGAAISPPPAGARRAETPAPAAEKVRVEFAPTASRTDDSTQPPQARDSSTSMGTSGALRSEKTPGFAARLKALPRPGLGKIAAGAKGAARKGTKLAGPVAIVGCSAFGMFHLVGMFADSPEAATGLAALATAEPAALETSLSPADLAGQTADLSKAQAATASLGDLIQTQLPMPEGVQVTPDKGLLEINTGGKHKIYVGDVFVGRGPVRRIPIVAGLQNIRIRLDGEERAFDAQVVAGQRTRLSPANPATQAALQQK